MKLILGNSGPLEEPVSEAVKKGDLVCCGVLSGNRNFEGRIHPDTRANYLASKFIISFFIFYSKIIFILHINFIVLYL